MWTGLLTSEKDVPSETDGRVDQNTRPLDSREEIQDTFRVSDLTEETSLALCGQDYAPMKMMSLGISCGEEQNPRLRYSTWSPRTFAMFQVTQQKQVDSLWVALHILKKVSLQGTMAGRVKIPGQRTAKSRPKTSATFQVT